MKRKIQRATDMPADAYRFWHERWCAILTKHHRQEIVDAGLAGLSFTERVPDAPDGKGYFSYAFAADGAVHFVEGEGGAVAEYDSYDLGLRLLSDAGFDAAQPIADGRFRIISKPEHWRALMTLLPILRNACRTAIEATEEQFDLEVPKYW